jgi:transmembrane sensor
MKTPNQREFLRIVDAYLEGNATPQQIDAVEKYYALFDDQPNVLDSLEEVAIRATYIRMKGGIREKINGNSVPNKNLYWRFLFTAAIVICVASSIIYYHRDGQLNTPVISNVNMQSDILPGSNRAVLILSDGQKISLNNAKIGKLANQSGVQVSKIDDSTLVYESRPIIAKGPILYNRIETPKGGQYQVTLPDGTKVWLNATSSLRYPLEFPGKERIVELTGEAYFEVARSKGKPFKVFTPLEKVIVLGTHFNINAYSDELNTKTSLIEGSVRVANISFTEERILKPGQQSILNHKNQKFEVNHIDVEEVIAWKNGYFMFDEEPLESILRKLARWYDVDIDYSSAPATGSLSFNGTLSKYNNVSQVLSKLELTRLVRFEIRGRKVLVKRWNY